MAQIEVIKRECAINCGDDDNHDYVKLPECSHYAHDICLNKLLEIRLSRCPTCRASIEKLRTPAHFKVIDANIRQEEEENMARIIEQSILDNYLEEIAKQEEEEAKRLEIAKQVAEEVERSIEESRKSDIYWKYNIFNMF